MVNRPLGVDLDPVDGVDVALAVQPDAPWRNTVRVGLLATWCTLGVLVVYPLLPGQQIDDSGSYTVILALAAVGAVSVAYLPWQTLYERGLGERGLIAWSAADITLVAWAIGITGGEGSDLFILYALTTVFYVATYPRWTQLGLTLYTAVSYLAAVDPGGGASAAGVFVRLALLGVLAAMVQLLVANLSDKMQDHHHARADAERRAELLASVAGAGRSLSDLDADTVLAAVVDTIVSLGFEGADLCMLESDGRHYRVIHPRGLPEAYTNRRHSADSGLVGRVLVERRSVLADYRSVPDGFDELRGHGFRAVISTPVWETGRIVGVLEGGTRGRSALRSEEVEAFELLAAHAGRALENARRYESEQRTVDKLTQVQRLKQEFLSTVSHELRTPLTVMSAIGASLERRWDTFDAETRLDLIERLNANTASLRRIVGELLDFSSFDPSRWEADLDVVELQPVIDDVVHRLGSLLESHEVHVAHDEAAPPVMGDAFLLERAIENLVSNAARHTPAGTKVCITLQCRGEQVEVVVADDGPGIPAEDLPHLGSRFFRGRGESVSRTRGLGLGLAFVKEILQLHGSDLEISNREEGGAQFAFTLAPRSRAGRPDQESVVTSRPEGPFV